MPNNVGENQAKRKLAAGELVLCMGVNQMRTPNIAMIAGACGFDAVYIDLEHNPTSLETAAAICVAALGIGITPIARVSSRDAHDATRILDCGAQGVMVPHVSTVAEARAVVESCRYPPHGHRSASGSGPALGYSARSQGEINSYLNEQTLLIAMLETPEAIENADAIAAIGGVREDLEFQTWLMQLGMRYLTGGSDVGYILSAGRADVKRLREVRLS
jgi:2-keto-3-deoxy-L-rhamnonate aldolase RhmA